MGHQQLKSKFSVIGRNISSINKTPEELPEYADGVLCRICLPNGELIPVSDAYEYVISKWHDSLDDL